ncbi:hypothetical protein HYW94_02470 [Candidatus Uhrbacteria bacterium]|nr:hypothetical protein [Candidatus Uhrbacteria bacterium]
MPIVEQKITAPSQEQAQVQEKKDVSASDVVKGFEGRAEALHRALIETEELAKSDPEKAAGQQKDLEAQIAGFWLNVRIAQASRVRLGDTPQETSKNAEEMNQLAEKLGSQPVDAYVYFLEKILRAFQETVAAIEEKFLKKESTLADATRDREDLSERLNDFIERKIFLVKEMLESRDVKKMPKEEKEILRARVQQVENKALSMCRASDVLLEAPQEKAEKK